ncbi:hypothetical protein [Nocardia cyriacigeorgica]|uniref:Uncharacterized protein n=1 Tax=Nocardia cyriacigeorgica TaxID=135487 RepID=A0A5R8N925_9NOCA|nr:hypothetical protein [Nocardia cyriacigeorgica]MBF6427465.1 hypothetical protein [Nocardia cyriacigeorgica]TLF72201.1 hypothetical protein FEK34_29500 [Nocardia cyriacigeorgica]
MSGAGIGSRSSAARTVGKKLDHGVFPGADEQRVAASDRIEGAHPTVVAQKLGDRNLETGTLSAAASRDDWCGCAWDLSPNHENDLVASGGHVAAAWIGAVDNLVPAVGVSLSPPARAITSRWLSNCRCPLCSS